MKRLDVTCRLSEGCNSLNEQVTYKRGWLGQKKTATGINYCQHGRLAKAKVTTCVWTQALSNSLRGFSKKKKQKKTKKTKKKKKKKKTAQC